MQEASLLLAMVHNNIVQAMDTYIISAIKERVSDKLYTLVGKNVLNVPSKAAFSLYDKVVLSNENEIKLAGYGSKRACSIAIGRMAKGHESKKIENAELAITAKKMERKLERAAKWLARAFISGAPISIRFHSDGDGATGALAVYYALNALGKSMPSVRWEAQHSIAYAIDSLYSDIGFFSNCKSAEKPKLVIIDFGTSPESNDAVNEIRKKGIDVIWLDHHPIPKGFSKGLKAYINPIVYGGTSDFTAGYLACIFAECISGIKTERLKGASLISDSSIYADKNDADAMEVAAVLDFITGVKKYTGYIAGPLVPSYFAKIIEDKEKLDEINAYANMVIDDMVSMGIKIAKRHMGKDGIEINVVDFEVVGKKYSGYVLPGRYSSKLHERIEAMNPESVTVVAFKNSISIRVSRKVSKKLDILKGIEEIKAEHDGVTGGGHESAAGVLAWDGGREEVLRELLAYMGASV